MHPAGFEPAIPAGERLQTHALDRSGTGIGMQGQGHLVYQYFAEAGGLEKYSTKFSLGSKVYVDV